MHIHRIAKLCEALHTAAGAAPEAVIRRGIHLEIAGRHRLEIGRHAALRILRGKNRVVICALIEIHVFAVAGDLKELAAEFQHIVGVAGLAVAVGALLIEDVILTEVLPFTVSAGDIGMVCRDHIPERFCIFQIARGVDLFTVDGLSVEDDIAFECADKLRDRRICVFIGQHISAAFQNGFIQIGLIEIVRCDRVRILSGDLIELIEAVVHAAVLDRKHSIMRLRAPFRRTVVCPVAEVGRDCFRGLIAGRIVYIDKTLNDLVHRIPRYPRLSDDIGLALFDKIKLHFDIVGIFDLSGPEKSGFSLGILLTDTHPVQQRLDLALKRTALCGSQCGILICLRNRREIMSDAVTGDQGIFPAGVALCAFSIELRIFAETAEQPFERQQIFDLF